MVSICLHDCVNRIRRQSGVPLPGALKDSFERGFGRPLDQVRLHVDRKAAEALGAEAFAVGRHVVLREAPGDWDAPTTRYLLGHEVAHCLQQGGIGDAAPVMQVGDADDPLEREAHQAAARLIAGRRAGRLTRDTQAVVRRKVSVAPATAAIIPQMKYPPQIKSPHLDSSGAPQMVFDSEEFWLQGTVGLTGATGDDLSGITLGWIQIEWSEKNYAIYRGLSNADGSLLIRRDRKPARVATACRDAWDPKDILYDWNTNGKSYVSVPPKTILADASKPNFLSCWYFDSPGSEIYVLQGKNNLTGQQNYLYYAEIEMRFCTVLTLLWPNGHFEHLKHVFWNLHWNYYFTPPAQSGHDWTVSPVYGPDPYPALGEIKPGAPTDSWAKLLTAAEAPNCLQLAADEVQKQILIPRKTWDDFHNEK